MLDRDEKIKKIKQKKKRREIAYHIDPSGSWFRIWNEELQLCRYNYN